MKVNSANNNYEKILTIGASVGSAPTGLNIKNSHWFGFNMVEYLELGLAQLQAPFGTLLFSFGKARHEWAIWHHLLSVPSISYTTVYWLGFRASIKIIITISMYIFFLICTHGVMGFSPLPFRPDSSRLHQDNCLAPQAVVEAGFSKIP